MIATTSSDSAVPARLTLPLEALHRMQSVLPPDQHPMVGLVEALLKHGSPWPLASARAVVALACSVPVDPALRIGDVPLLHAVLRGTEPRPVAPDAVVRRAATLEALMEAAPQTWGADWLAHALLLSGADPWSRHPWPVLPKQAPVDPTDALDVALYLGRDDLVERMLAMPGAPSGVQRMDQPCPFEKTLSWWQVLCRGNGYGPLFACLRRHGMDPNRAEHDGRHPLEQASWDTVGHYASAGWLPEDPTTRRSILTAWINRSLNGPYPLHLEEDSLHAMTRLLTQSEAAVGLVKREILIRTLMGVGYVGMPRDRIPAPELLGQIRVEEEDGSRTTWSGLVALAAAQIRAANPVRGPDSWVWPASPPEDVPDAEPGTRGHAAFGFDWRPGVPAAGILALSVAGDASANAPAHERLLAWLGVSNFSAWTLSHLPDAVSFTEAVLQSASGEKQRTGLIQTWQAVFKQWGAPHAWEGGGFELTCRLLRALQAPLGGSSEPGTQKFSIELSELADLWFGDREPDAPPLQRFWHARAMLQALEMLPESWNHPLRWKVKLADHSVWSDQEHRAEWLAAVEKRAYELKLWMRNWGSDKQVTAVVADLEDRLLQASTPHAGSRVRQRM